LLNLGTPDSTQVACVRRYLREFLSDPRVIDIPRLSRFLLLNLVILPFRPKASAEAYRKVWTDRGSPLMFHGTDLVDRVARALGDDAQVELAMRYQNPSVAAALDRFRAAGVGDIVVLPLFPQYSSAAWGSAVEKVFVEVGCRWNVPSIHVVPPFYDHPAYLEACASVARPVLDDFEPDRILMSFHGLPERQVIKSDDAGGTHCLRRSDCCDKIGVVNRNCYRAQSFATARALAARLGLTADDYEVAFQSRLGRSPWIRPYTDVRVRELAHSGVRRLAVLSPSFVADCLETIEEIGMRAADDFVAHGGEALRLVPSLNSEPVWVDALLRILADTTPRVAVPARETIST